MTPWEKKVKIFAISLGILIIICLLGGIISVISTTARVVSKGVEKSGKKINQIKQDLSESLNEEAEYSFLEDDVEELQIENGFGDVKIESSQDSQIYVYVPYASTGCSVELRNHTLYIENAGIDVQVFGLKIGERVEQGKENEIFIRIPEGKEFEQIEINNASGNIDVQELNAEKFTFNNATGKAYFHVVCAESMEMSSMMGTVSLKHVETEKVFLNAAAGSVRIGFDDSADQYDMMIKKGSGVVKIDGLKQEASEIAHTNKDADKRMNIKCGSSVIDLVFEQ